MRSISKVNLQTRTSESIFSNILKSRTGEWWARGNMVNIPVKVQNHWKLCEKVVDNDNNAIDVKVNTFCKFIIWSLSENIGVKNFIVSARVLSNYSYKNYFWYFILYVALQRVKLTRHLKWSVDTKCDKCSVFTFFSISNLGRDFKIYIVETQMNFFFNSYPLTNLITIKFLSESIVSYPIRICWMRTE